jgi:hypothetical protein
MARRYSVETTGVLDGTGGKLQLGKAQFLRNGDMSQRFSYTTVSDAIADDIVIGQTFPGMVFEGIEMVASATLGGVATIVVGVPGDTARYVAARNFTSADAPTNMGKASQYGVEETTTKPIIITVAAAALPAGVTIKGKVRFSQAGGG